MSLSKIRIDYKVLVLMQKNFRFSSTATATAETSEKSNTTVDIGEIGRLSKLSTVWWDLSGPMRPLHSMNKLRVQLVRDCILYMQQGTLKEIKASQPLNGMKVMDVGCGGGILTEPLARIGATVTGLDASSELIDIAKEHAIDDAQINEKIEYVCGSVEDHADTRTNYYDAVIASEVIEHVKEKELFLDAISRSVKPGGSIIITTLNKTMMSWVLGVIAAEYVLNIVPQETHDWEKFLPPRELQFMLEKHGCYTNLIHGFYYNVMRDEWFWTPSTAINYALHAVKKK